MSKTTVLFFLAALAAPAAFAIEIDGVAARVASETILKSDVIKEMHRARVEPSRYREVLDELIERKLILKAAGEAKMTMQEWVVENRVREIVNRSFEGDRNRLVEALAKEKISYPEWYARMKEDLIVSAMRYQIVEKNVSASPAALRREYTEHADRYRIGGTVTVSAILLKPEDAARRDEISEALKTTPFADLARKHSADAHAAQGGLWKDIVPADNFNAEICEEIAKMPVGTLSRWIVIDGWSYLLRKESEKAGLARSFAEAAEDVERNVRDAEATRLYKAWVARLREETYVKVFEPN